LLARGCCAGLRSLTFFAGIEARASFNFAAHLPLLETLRVRGYAGDDLRFLRGFDVGNTQIELNGDASNHQIFGAPRLSRFARLTSLSITDSVRVTSLDWIHLVAPTLRVLDVSRTSLHRISPLLTLTNLQTLFLDNLQPQTSDRTLTYPSRSVSMSTVTHVSLIDAPTHLYDFIKVLCCSATVTALPVSSRYPNFDTCYKSVDIPLRPN